MFNPIQYQLFYNTIKEPKAVVAQYEAANATQEENVLEYFQREKRATALQCAVKLGMHESSCRRSVTNLMKQGKLRKTDVKVMEKYGKPNYLFEIV